MSANFYAWPTTFDINPSAKDFLARIEALYESPREPDPKLQAFVAALLERYPDLSEENPEAVWAAGPLQDEVVGSFLNVAVAWKRSDEVWAFFRETARIHGLVCYDPQSERIYEP